MADETLTLALHGEVSLDAFATAVAHWRGLIDALTEQTAGGARVRWVIEELSASSAIMTARAETDAPEAVAPVVTAYEEVGEVLREGQFDLLETRVRKEALPLTALIHRHVDFIRLETAKRDLVVTTNYDELIGDAAPSEPWKEALPSAYGVIQGHIQTLSSRGHLRFTLYDTLFDKAVNCYLSGGQEEIMRDAWGQTAVVEGVVTRDPKIGRPLNIRDVWNVTPVRTVERFAYSNARGVVQVPEGDHRTPEELVAAIR